MPYSSLIVHPLRVALEVSGAFPDKMLAAQHLLLFVSALIPKAMSSLLTSAVIELSKSENVRIEPRIQDLGEGNPGT